MESLHSPSTGSGRTVCVDSVRGELVEQCMESTCSQRFLRVVNKIKASIMPIWTNVQIQQVCRPSAMQKYPKSVHENCCK